MRLQVQKEAAWNKHILCFQISYKNVGLQAKRKVTKFKNVSQKNSFPIYTVISSASGGQNIFKLHFENISALPNDWYGIWNSRHSDRYQKQTFSFLGVQIATTTCLQEQQKTWFFRKVRKKFCFLNDRALSPVLTPFNISNGHITKVSALPNTSFWINEVASAERSSLK